MEHAPCISQIATLLADPKRSAMMWALMDGSARQTEELALLAGLSPSSASAHLARLATGGLLKVEVRGRKRFFRLSAPEVGAAIEALASATIASAPREVAEVFKRSTPMAKPQSAPSSLLRARFCDDHLGGTLAADLYQRLLDAGWIEQLEQRVVVTLKGAKQLAGPECSSRRWPIATSRWRVPVRIGVSAAHTWAAPSARRCCSCSCSRAG